MRLIAIIGTRNPDDEQINNCLNFIDNLSEDDCIISGCAYGIDSFALAYAHSKGLKTIGVVPWESYNEDVQESCDSIIILDILVHLDAILSVREFHPAFNKLSQGAFKLHARNYLIVKDADYVLAYPGPTGGGTMQGIKVAQSFGIHTLINPHLKPEL